MEQKLKDTNVKIKGTPRSSNITKVCNICNKVIKIRGYESHLRMTHGTSTAKESGKYDELQQQVNSANAKLIAKLNDIYDVLRAIRHDIRAMEDKFQLYK